MPAGAISSQQGAAGGPARTGRHLVAEDRTGTPGDPWGGLGGLPPRGAAVGLGHVQVYELVALGLTDPAAALVTVSSSVGWLPLGERG